MKTKITLIVSFVVILFLSCGLVSTQSSNAASVSVNWVTPAIHAGDMVTIIITFTSNIADQLEISRLGVHFDWMESNQFFTRDLSTNPLTVPNNSTRDFDPITIQIPPYVTAGSHNYYVAIDGTQGASTPFAWDSAQLVVDILPLSSTSATPTPTPSANTEGGSEGQPNLLLYGAIAAVVIIVVLLIVALVLRKKRKHPKPETTPAVSEPETPKSEEKPSPEQDFNI